MKPTHLIRLILFSHAFLFLTLNSPASNIPGVTVQALSDFTSGSDQRRATNLLNDSGLFGDVLTTTPQGAMWVSFTNTLQALTNEVITFDLGSIRPIHQMRVWGYNEGANVNTPKMGLQRADILTSDDGVNFTTNLPNYLFNVAAGTFTRSDQLIDFAGISTRYVRLNVITNYGSSFRVGIGKVRFIDTNVPPRVNFASRNYSSNKVTVIFSESVAAASATNLGNYAIQTDGTNSATLLSASMDPGNNSVVFLQTSTLSNANYTLLASQVAALIDGSKITNNSAMTIEPELALWLRADAGVTADGGGLVSQWDDQSGRGNNALQSEPAFQPTLTAGAFNGKPALHFFNSNPGFTNYMEVAHASSLVVRGDLSIFAVVSLDDLVNINTFIGKTLGNQPSPFDYYALANSGFPRCFRGNGSGSSSATAVIGLTNLNQAYIASLVVRGTNGSHYLNGAFNGSGSLVAGLGDAERPIRIGSRVDYGTRLKGNLAELMVIRGSLSDAERASINEYLGAKYAIPVVSLSFTQQPTNTTKLEGQTATFVVGVAANSSSITYQWQRNLTNIPNATNFSYTTPTLTLADHNSSYRVQVAIPGTSQFSDSATLAVLVDNEKPTVISAGRRIWNPTELVVEFSESVTPNTATNSGSYGLDNGALVTGVTLGDSARRVVLSTSGMTNGGAYLLSVQNVVDLFNNTMLPAQVAVGLYPAGLALWLKADTGVAVDSSNYVTQWDDQSGNGNNATPTFGVPFTPTWVTNSYNNLPTLRFDGVDAFLGCGSPGTLALTGDLSIYAVASIVDYANHNGLVGKTTVNQAASYDFYLLQGTGQPRLVRGNGAAGSSIITAVSPASLGVPHLIYATMLGNTVSHYLDATTNGTGVVTQPMVDNGDPLLIGSRSDLATKLKGDLSEVLIFGSALQDADRMAMDSYLAAKYSLVLGSLPAISIVPGSGSSLLLSWPVSNLNFLLEAAPNLSGLGWQVVTNSVTTAGGTNSVTLNAVGVQQFYRLHKQ